MEKNTVTFYIHDEVYVTKKEVVINNKINETLEKGISLEEAIEKASSKLGNGTVGAFAQFQVGQIEKLPYKINWSQVTKEMMEKGFFIIVSKQKQSSVWLQVDRKSILSVVDYSTAKREQDWKFGNVSWFPNRQMAVKKLFDKTNNPELGGVYDVIEFRKQGNAVQRTGQT